jgi:SAM-dependent methyltransferase
VSVLLAGDRRDALAVAREATRRVCLALLLATTVRQAVAGVRRALALWRLFRNEPTDPVPFYRRLAADAAADLDRRHGPLAGQTIVDLGCGPGHYTRAFPDRGATVIPVDIDPAEMALEGGAPEGAVLADAGALPLGPASVDGAFCSNLLEHPPEAEPVIARVLRPGGWGYISWTNWYSPWGGHDMSPYHYLGRRLYQRRHGPPRKNPSGAGLWARHIGSTLRLVRARPGLEIERVEPRYWPRLAFLCRIPGLRELVTWNCVIGVRRR